MPKTVVLPIEIDLDDNGAIAKVRQLDKSVDGLGGTTGRTTQVFGGLKAMLGSLGIAYVAKQALDLGVNLAKSALVTANEFEQLQIRLTSLRGNAKMAEADFAWIKKFAIDTPASLQEVTKAFSLMMAYGLEPTTGTMQKVTDAGFALTGSMEGVERITRALGQAWAKQKLQGQEILQLTEAGVPVWELLEQATGKNVQQLQKMSEKGELTRDVIQQLIDAMGERYAGAASAQMETLAGKVSNLGDAWDQALAIIGGQASDEAKAALDGLIDAVQQFIDSGAAVDIGNALAKAIRGIGAAAQFATDHLDDFRGIIEFVLRARQAIGSFGPFGAVFNLGAGVGASGERPEIQVRNLADVMKKLDDEMADYYATLKRGAPVEKEHVDSLDKAAKKAAEKRKQLGYMIDDLEWETETLVFNLQRWGEWDREARQAIDAVARDLDAYTDGLDQIVMIPAGPDAPWAQAVQSTFSDLLGKGFAGELDSFSDLWDEVWQDLAKSMTGALGDALEGWIKGGRQGGLGGLFSDMGDAVSKQGIGAYIGGLGMVAGGAQQGGIGGFLQGALGGGALGLAHFGPLAPYAVGVSALVGGLASLFGGGDSKPRSQFLYTGTGFQLTGARAQKMSDESKTVWEQSMNAVLTNMHEGWNDALRKFGDPSLFDLVGSLQLESGKWVDMSADALAKWLAETALPGAFTGAYRSAIDEGLSGLGATGDTIQTLWTTLARLPGSERMRALEDYISALVGLTNLADDLDWNAILDEGSRSSFEAFSAGIGSIRQQIDAALGGWDDLSLIERARQAQDIEALVYQARAMELQMLQQIRSTAQSIQQSIGGQIEGLQLGGMTSEDQAGFYRNRITQLVGQIGTQGYSPETIQFLISQIQGYASQYASLVGPEGLYSTGVMGSDQSIADWLIEMLRRAEETALGQLSGLEDEIRAGNEDLLEITLGLVDGLTNFGDSVRGLPEELDFVYDRFDRLGQGAETATDSLLRLAAAADRVGGLGGGGGVSSAQAQRIAAQTYLNMARSSTRRMSVQ